MSEEKLESKYYKLERLLKWEHCAEVNEMLMGGVSPHKVSAWCKERDFSISHPKLYEYKGYLQEALTRQITVERLLGIGVPKRRSIQLQALGLQSVKSVVRNEMEVLDGIIQLGFNALTASPTVKLQDAMKAIELKNKLTNGTHGGLTSYGLDQLRELEQAKFNTLVEVVMKYIPEEHIQELEEAIATAERVFYETRAPELLDDYERSIEEELANSVIVSDTQF
jgi:hypothetical protein